MKVLIYKNVEKDVKDICINTLIEQLSINKIEYEVLRDADLQSNFNADALFSIGGDGTILFLSEFAKRNAIPIIGINAGKLGFLCEFERKDIKDAVEYLVNNKFIKDRRLMLKIAYHNKIFYALNDVYIQRAYENASGNMVADISVIIDDALVTRYKGDGAIVSSPTGSTAYSFSLGGPLVSPHTAAFIVTPIAAHSFNQRPIVYSAGSTCELKIADKTKVGVFIDGKLSLQLDQNDSIKISCAEKPVTFLRRENYNFFMKLTDKLNNKGGFNE